MSYINYDGKKVFYDSTGVGYPLLLLHGNVVSSKMFFQEIDFYKDFFKVIFFDYPGHGKSERVTKFAPDFWHYNAGAAKQVLDKLNIEKIHVIGTSGGALVGLNLAGLIPQKISKMIVDSFFGLRLPVQEAEMIIKKRTKAKSDLMTSSFWEFMHGEDWESIIDMDFEMLLTAAKQTSPIIKTDLTKLEFPVLAVASTEDELIGNIDERTREVIDLIPYGRAMVFDEGKHPFMITMREKFRDIALEFLMSD